MLEPSASVTRVSTATTPSAPSPDGLRGLVAGLVDDAAVFPPAARDVAEAVTAHRGHRRAWYADLVGPLLVRASQVPDLLAALHPGDDLAVGLVADTGLVGLAEARNALLDHDEQATLVQVEVALPAGHDPGAAARAMLDQLAFSTQAYVEVPPGPGSAGALDVLAEDGAERAKLRTGGPTPDHVPSEAEVAAFLRGCLDRGLAFKLTAGLHHALRGAADGLEHHGFLNVLAAVAAGLAGADAEGLAGLLAERRPGPVLAALAAAPAPAVRRAFVSFGCCDVTDPVAELVALGLLEEDVA